MKTIDLFCASPASTAICSSMDKTAVIRHTPRRRSIDHYRLYDFHYEFDEKPKNRATIMPCSPQIQPFTPMPYHDYQKLRKSTSSSSSSSNSPSIKKSELLLSRRRNKNSAVQVDDLFTPRRSSSRYHLLSEDQDPPLIDFSSESSDSSYESTFGASSSPLSRHQRRLTSSNDHHTRPRVLTKSFSTRAPQSSPDSPVFSPSYSSSRSQYIESTVQKSSLSRLRDQVVELRVSIHCKGCEGKVRKHLSRMEGVKSFSIDLATKKVTVIGDITPLSVLSSISKVKSAQFWPSPSSSSSSVVGRRTSYKNI